MEFVNEKMKGDVAVGTVVAGSGVGGAGVVGIVDPLTLVTGLIALGFDVQQAGDLAMCYYQPRERVTESVSNETDSVGSVALGSSSATSARSLRRRRLCESRRALADKPGYCYLAVVRVLARADVAKSLGPDPELGLVFSLPASDYLLAAFSENVVQKVSSGKYHLESGRSGLTMKQFALDYFSANPGLDFELRGKLVGKGHPARAPLATSVLGTSGHGDGCFASPTSDDEFVSTTMVLEYESLGFSRQQPVCSDVGAVSYTGGWLSSPQPVRWGVLKSSSVLSGGAEGYTVPMVEGFRLCLLPTDQIRELNGVSVRRSVCLRPGDRVVVAPGAVGRRLCLVCVVVEDAFVSETRELAVVSLEDVADVRLVQLGGTAPLSGPALFTLPALDCAWPVCLGTTDQAVVAVNGFSTVDFDVDLRVGDVVECSVSGTSHVDVVLQAGVPSGLGLVPAGVGCGLLPRLKFEMFGVSRHPPVRDGEGYMSSLTGSVAKSVGGSVPWAGLSSDCAVLSVGQRFVVPFIADSCLRVTAFPGLIVNGRVAVGSVCVRAGDVMWGFPEATRVAVVCEMSTAVGGGSVRSMSLPDIYASTDARIVYEYTCHGVVGSVGRFVVPKLDGMSDCVILSRGNRMVQCVNGFDVGVFQLTLCTGDVLSVRMGKTGRVRVKLVGSTQEQVSFVHFPL